MFKNLLNGVSQAAFCELELTGLVGFGAFTPSGGAPYVNSIQQVSITLGSTVTSNTASISAVSANAFIIFQGITTDGTAINLELDTYSKVVLTNTTTVTASRNTGVGAVTVNALIIDPTASLVTGVQAGTITITAGTSNTATITSVNTALSAVFYLGNTTIGTDSASAQAGVTLTDATTVTASLAATGTITVSYVVVTFAAAAIQSIQQYASTSTANTTGDTVTITAVTTANSMIAYGGIKNAAADDYKRTMFWDTLTNTTTVTFTRAAASASSRTYYGTVIEFKTGVLKTVNRGSIVVSAVTSATATITAVTTAKTASFYLGQLSTNGSDGNEDREWARIDLTNTTTVTATKQTASNSVTVGYEVIEFN